MRLIKCKRCSETVEASGTQAYCDTCRKLILQASTVRPRLCRDCGKAFDGYPRSYYCPDCQAERKRASTRASKAATRAGTTRKLGSTDLCVSCGAEYTVNSARQRYCPDCAKSIVPATVNRQKRAYSAAHRDDYQSNKSALRQGRKVCVVCGKTFDGRPVTVTCSDECRKIRRRELQRAADQIRKTKKETTP